MTVPWSIFVADNGIQVHQTTQRQDSPQEAVATVSDPAGNSVVWAGKGSALFMISGRASDFTERVGQGMRVEVHYRVDQAPEEKVSVGMRCTEPLCGTQGGAMLNVTTAFKSATPGSWRTMSIPLSCFAASAVELTEVEVPFAMETAGRFGLSIASVSLLPQAAGTAERGPETI